MFHHYKELATEQVKACSIVIDSNGGNVEAGLDIYNLIRLSSIVNGIATTAFVARASNSAAMLVLLGCDYRIGLSESRYLMHPVSRPINFNLPFINKMIRNKSQMEDWLKSLRFDISVSQKGIDRIYRDRTGMVDEMILMANKKEMTLNANQAQRAGIIHEVMSI
jgi:ATP-dependent protease ClpP protease subunit